MSCFIFIFVWRRRKTSMKTNLKIMFSVFETNFLFWLKQFLSVFFRSLPLSFFKPQNKNKNKISSCFVVIISSVFAQRFLLLHQPLNNNNNSSFPRREINEDGLHEEEDKSNNRHHHLHDNQRQKSLTKLQLLTTMLVSADS